MNQPMKNTARIVSPPRTCSKLSLSCPPLLHLHGNREFHFGAGGTAEGAADGGGEQGVAGGGDGDVGSGDGEGARRVVAAPAGAFQVDFGPGVEIAVFLQRGVAFVTADKTGGES